MSDDSIKYAYFHSFMVTRIIDRTYEQLGMSLDAVIHKCISDLKNSNPTKTITVKGNGDVYCDDVYDAIMTRDLKYMVENQFIDFYL